MVEPFHDETFGPLWWDPLLDCLLGGIDWPPGLHTEVAIRLPDGDRDAGLRLAREGLAWLQAHESPARRAVATVLLTVYNDDWRQEDEPITEAEFVRRIELVRIWFEDDGSVLLSYDGRDLFDDRVIDAEFRADRSFGGAGLDDQRSRV